MKSNEEKNNDNTRVKMVKCKNKLTLVKHHKFKCESCGGSTFKQTLLLKKDVSFSLTKVDKKQLIPMQVFACEKCGHVNKEFTDVSGLQ